MLNFFMGDEKTNVPICIGRNGRAGVKWECALKWDMSMLTIWVGYGERGQNFCKNSEGVGGEIERYAEKCEAVDEGVGQSRHGFMILVV